MITDLPSENNENELRSEARRWIVRLHSGEFSRADADALRIWREKSPAHQLAFGEANATWNALQAAARKLPETKHNPEVLLGPATRFSRRVWLGGAMAASIGGVAYLAARPPLYLWPSLAELAADYRTDVGERRHVAFAGSNSVELNTRTSLSITGEAERKPHIELIAGEIAVTAERGLGFLEPFVVVAGNGRASASQAKFDLRRDEEIVTVSCLEGEVRVECEGRMELLSPHQRVGYDRRGLGAVATVDGRIVEAWRQGLLIFDNQPLAQVISEINRYRRGRIILMSDEIGSLPLDATFRLDRIDEAVPKIAQIFDLKIRSLAGGILLLG